MAAFNLAHIIKNVNICYDIAMPELPFVLAAVSGVLALGSFIPYIVTTLQGATKPNRVTWCIWTLQGWILTSTYYLSGGGHNIWLPLADTVLVSVIAILSLRYGAAEFTKVDTFSILGALVSILLWILLGSPLTALYFGIVVSLIGAVPTLVKTYRAPDTEHSLSWGIFSCAAIINLFALPTLWAAENIYPFYLLFINGLIFLLAFFGKRLRS